MPSSSFYTDGETYDTAVVVPNDNPSSTTPSQAPSSFYPDGGRYFSPADGDAIATQIEALLAQVNAGAANAAASATAAAASAAAAAASVPQASTANPVVDGTASPGTSNSYSRGDHVHPTDTSRAALSYVDTQLATKASTSALATKADVSELATKADVSALAAKADTATVNTQLDAKAPIASPAFTGTPTAPTASVGDNSTQIATTAFVQANAGAPKVSFSAYSTIDLTGVPSSTNAKVLFQTEEWDEGGHYDTSASRWTPPAGRGRINASAYFSAGVVDQNQYQIFLYKNGAIYKVLDTILGSGTTGIGPSGSCSFTSNGTDYFEIVVYGGGAGSKTILGNAGITYFQGEMF